MDRLRFQSFASGSSGNCYFIGNASRGILIDAGIGVRTIRRNLRALGLDFHNLWGIFVTHDHADHIRSIGALGEIHHVPVYTTRKIHDGIQRSYCVTEKLTSSRRYLEKQESVEVGGFTVRSFHVSHDASDNVGYTIEYMGKRFTFATDLGYVCESAARELEQAHYMVFEANYDAQMLAAGYYPADLKRRIKSDTGHLSNDQCGDFLSKNYRSHLQYVFLCHLSKENNRPELAYTTVKSYLEKSNIKVGEDVKLVTLDRFNPTELFIFD